MSRRTQEERSRASRTKIIEGALDVLSEVGFESMTFSRIQDVSGISRGLVSYHFGTKEALVEELVLSLRDRYQSDELGESLVSLDGRRSLNRMVDRYIARLAQDFRPAKVMILLGTMSESEYPSIRSAIDTRYAEMREEIAGFISLGVEDGSIITDQDPQLLAVVIQGMLRGIALQYIVNPSALNLAAVRSAASAQIDALSTATV